MKQIIIIIPIITIIFACNHQPNITTEVLDQVQMDSVKRIECQILLEQLQETEASKINKIKTKPSSLEESLIVLDSMFTPEMKEWIKCLPDKEFAGYVHHGLGMHLRNTWGLWGNSKLAQDISELGIFHPDDMSGIILDSYQRKLKEEDINLEEQLKFYHDYWREQGMPIDSLLEELDKKKKQE